MYAEFCAVNILKLDFSVFKSSDMFETTTFSKRICRKVFAFTRNVFMIPTGLLPIVTSIEHAQHSRLAPNLLWLRSCDVSAFKKLRIRSYARTKRACASPRITDPQS